MVPLFIFKKKSGKCTTLRQKTKKSLRDVTTRAAGRFFSRQKIFCCRHASYYDTLLTFIYLGLRPRQKILPRPLLFFVQTQVARESWPDARLSFRQRPRQREPKLNYNKKIYSQSNQSSDEETSSSEMPKNPKEGEVPEGDRSARRCLSAQR